MWRSPRRPDAVPGLFEEDEPHVASTLRRTAVAFAAGGLIWSAGSVLLFRGPGIQGLLPLGLVLASGASLAVLRRGSARAASWLLVASIWLIMTASVVASGRIDAPGYAGYLVAIVAAGLLLGRREVLGVAGLSILAGAALSLAQHAGALPAAGPPRTTLSTWLTESVLFAVTAIVLYVAAGRTREALAWAQHEHNFNAAILDTVAALVVVLDAEGRIVRFNRACERLSGFRSEDVRGRPFLDLLIAPDEAAGVKHVFERLRAGECPLNYENDWVASDGDRHRIVWSNTVLPDERGGIRYVIGTGIDITARRRLEEELLHSQKMEAVGRLAGGIAHDFNNILLTIGGRAEQLLQRVASADPLRRDVLEIDKACRRAASLTRQLLTFSRRDPPAEQTAVDVNAAIEAVGEMLRPLIGEDIELVTRLAPDAGRVRADASRIEQMVLNLALNARDAMRAGGRLEIETAALGGEDPPAPGRSSAGWLSLTVRDNGSGMDAETRRRAFEPFFTRKAPGRGTGLGLSAVYGIVRQAGGEVRLDSTPGEGTTVRVFLPRIEGGPPARVSDWTEPDVVPAPSHATILLVEDDRAAREMLRDYLEWCGFRVLTAASGPEAVEAFRKEGDGIDVVVTDWIMPGMSGPELAERIHAGNGRTRLLFMTGYAEQSLAFDRFRARGASLLRKPFTLRKLTAEVRSLLEAHPPNGGL